MTELLAVATTTIIIVKEDIVIRLAAITIEIKLLNQVMTIVFADFTTDTTVANTIVTVIDTDTTDFASCITIVRKVICKDLIVDMVVENMSYSFVAIIVKS